MALRLTTMERAFQIAKGGAVLDLSGLKTLLTREGYDSNQIQGPALSKQLLELMKVAQTGNVPDFLSHEVTR